MTTLPLNTALASTKKSTPTPDQKKAQRASYLRGQEADIEAAVANRYRVHWVREAFPEETEHLPHGGTVLVVADR